MYTCFLDNEYTKKERNCQARQLQYSSASSKYDANEPYDFPETMPRTRARTCEIARRYNRHTCARMTISMRLCARDRYFVYTSVHTKDRTCTWVRFTAIFANCISLFADKVDPS